MARAVPSVFAPVFMTEASKTHYQNRIQEIDRQPDLVGGIIFIGDDLTETAMWGVLFPDADIRNHGIAGDTTSGVEKRLHLLTRHKPEQIYLMIGEGDGVYGRTTKDVSESVVRILVQLRKNHPTAQIFLQTPIPRDASLLAWNQDLNTNFLHLLKQPDVKSVGIDVIDLLPAYISRNGKIKADLYKEDGALDSHGYAVWGSILGRFVAKTIR